MSKKSKNNVKRFSFIKLFTFLLFIALIIGFCYLFYKLYVFESLAKPMFSNLHSSIYDTDNNLIAQVGIERNRENIEYEDIPVKLVNAYISIEDERFFTHHGVDIKRTGAAILSYITKRRFLFFWWKYHYTATCKKHNW